MTSPADLSTMVYFKSSVQVLRLLCTVHKLYAFFERSIMAVCRFRPLGATQIGSNIAIQKFDHGFLFVFNSYYVHKVHRSKVIPNFLLLTMAECGFRPLEGV
jgi:NADH:ubiquinone oxidoreductase subunit H